jgi:hypothetical protein
VKRLLLITALLLPALQGLAEEAVLGTALRTRIEAFCQSSTQSLDLMLPSHYDEE